MEKNKVMMIVIVVLLVLLLGLLGVGFVYVGNLLKNTQMAEGSQGGNSNNWSMNASQLDPKEIYLFALEKPVATNLKKGADGSSHSASVSFSVGIDNTRKKDSDEAIALIIEKEAMVRDICLSTMRSMTHEELSREDGMDILRNEVLNKLRDEFHSNLIVSVSISDWYLEP